jgi:hypothetical protein
LHPRKKIIGATLLLFLLAYVFGQSPLRPNEERGRQIYERGVSASVPPIKAVLGSGETISGAILPCANCHGHDGQGRPEGGVAPSNITWEVLTKPYGGLRSDGRTRVAYTERLVRRAFAMGIDASGGALNEAMPRFQMSLADAADLVAYIKKLGQTVDPGLDENTVRLGVLLPPAYRKILIDYFARVNENGGIYSRHFELVLGDFPAEPAKRAGWLREFLTRENVFTIVSADLTGAEHDIASVLRDTGMPAIATFAPFPDTGTPLNPWVFYLDGGTKVEQAALNEFAARRHDAPSVMLTASSLFEDPTRLSRTEGNARVLVATGASSPDVAQAVWERVVSSAAIEVEAVRRSGRTLTRRKLTEALESFDRVNTSLRVPITFGRSERIGTRDVRIMMLDPKTHALLPFE